MMTKNLPADFQITSYWRTDNRAYDPSTIVMRFRYRGEMFEATNRLGPGWPMTVRTCTRNDLWSASANWENWGQAIEHIDARVK